MSKQTLEERVASAAEDIFHQLGVNPTKKQMEKYKIVFMPAIENSSDAVFEEEFGTLKEAKVAIRTVANYTLMLHECSLMPDYSNAGWIEKLKDGEWVEVEEVEI